MLQFKVILAIAFFMAAAFSSAQCVIYQGDAPITRNNQDALTILLEQENRCPKSIQQLIQRINKNQLQLKTSMVANRGKNNPLLGSFSFFSSIEGTMPTGYRIEAGDFFLGHFTRRDREVLRLDQQPKQNKLLIELIAWDRQQQVFNFYELRGLTADTSRWFYRGNSKDAYSDNQYLYRRPAKGEAKFGTAMRCSACHNSGGPIMKEIQLPHNDWWRSSNPLIFSPNHPDVEVNELVEALIDADDFADDVKKGMEKLNRSESFKQFKQGLSLQEQLRPLFCTQEINIESSADQDGASIHIPSGFWLNPLLGRVDLHIKARDYQRLLALFRIEFPETTDTDADHAWLTPVKGISDLNAIKGLMLSQRLDQHFVESVLMIDYRQPLFSKARCDLLQYLPVRADQGWIETFILRLRLAKKNQGNAALLADYLGYPDQYNHHYFKQIIADYNLALQNELSDEAGQRLVFARLLQARQDVRDSEISKNPLGEILEPGFRVIFPVSKL